MKSSSQLVQQVGAVAIIKSRTLRNARLVVNSTLAHFERTCYPGTLMSLNFSTNSTIQVTARLTNESSTVDVFGQHQLVFDSPGSCRASVTPAMYDSIQQILIGQGGVPLRGTPFGRFSTCSPDIVRLLPTIEFATPAGSLIFYPDDYIDFNPQDNSCRLRIAEGRDGADIRVSPMLLVDTNVRVDKDGIWMKIQLEHTWDSSFEIQNLVSPQPTMR